ncbi:sugar ABC transporter permease [Candidatus Bipolaricaulota bacterium]|nr:sugar ABC transporter permease [Candidatus Bipolaricaulota bacterium]
MSWEGLGGFGHFTGLKNYIELFTQDSVFRKGLLNTLLLSVAFIGITIPLGLINAILLDMGIKGKKLFRLIFLIPLSFSFVVSAAMWAWMFAPKTGTINSLLRVLNLGFFTQPWLTSSSQSMLGLIIIYVWQFSGFATLVYFAGISGVKQEIIEAAKVDGASQFQKYLRIIIPLQKIPTFTILFLLLMYSLRVFDLVWLTTGGGPGYSSEILATYMWRITFNRNLFADGASIGFVMFIMSALIAVPFVVKMRGK